MAKSRRLRISISIDDTEGYSTNRLAQQEITLPADATPKSAASVVHGIVQNLQTIVREFHSEVATGEVRVESEVAIG